MNDHGDFVGLEDWLRSVIASQGITAVDRVLLVSEAGSTQDVARQCCEDRSGLLVVADRQLAGRGRLGRTWADTGGLGVAATFVVPYTANPGLLSIQAGLAACTTIETALKAKPVVEGTPTSLEVAADVLAIGSLFTALDWAFARSEPGPVGIRWPNDIVEVDHGKSRKLAGVLVEQTDRLAFVGIGINVDQRQDDFPASLVGKAASTRMLGCRWSRSEVLKALLCAFERCLTLSGRELLNAWYPRDALARTHCVFEHNGVRYEGRVLGIDPMSHIEVMDVSRGRVKLPALTTSVLHDP